MGKIWIYSDGFAAYLQISFKFHSNDSNYGSQADDPRPQVDLCQDFARDLLPIEVMEYATLRRI